MHKQTAEHNSTTNSEPSTKGRCFQFPVVSNVAIQDLNSVAVNKHSQNMPCMPHKTLNERTCSEAGASPAILKQMGPQELDNFLSIKFYAEVIKIPSPNKKTRRKKGLPLLIEATRIELLSMKKTVFALSSELLCSNEF